MLLALLTLAFTPRFSALTHFQIVVYVTSLVIGAGATALLIAPAAFHRIVFHRDLKHALVEYSNRFAYFGLIMLMLALSGALLLILDVALGSPPVGVDHLRDHGVVRHVVVLRADVEPRQAPRRVPTVHKVLT